MLVQGRTWERNADPDRLDQVIEWLLILLLAFAPLAFGVVAAWSEEIVLILAALIFVCFWVKATVLKKASPVWTGAGVPLLVIILVATVQIVPLPVSLVRAISPHTVTQKTELLSDLYGATALPSLLQISFYPSATRHDLRLALAATALFVVVLSVFRRPDQIMRLLLIVAVIGGGVALVALAQDLIGNNRIYGFVATPHGRAFSGPFVNHSHYAQFMSLSIGASLAVIFVKMHKALGAGRTTPATVAEYLSSSEGRLIWGLCVMIALGAATIFASLSRGGMISLIMAGVFTTLVFCSTKSLKGSGWIMALMALGAFIGVLYVGFDTVYERLGTLRDLNRAQGGRWQIVKDVAVAWTRFPVLGTGLGTHEVVYPMFDRSTSAALASHAENEYAQAAEETGAIGLAALLAFAAFAWHSYAKAVRTARRPIRSAAYGLGFGLAAVMVHSLGDFGQHLPANAFLTIVFCALLIRLPHVSLNRGVPQAPVTGESRFRAFRWLSLAAACLVWGWAILDADAARRGETYWGKALAVESGLRDAQRAGSDEEYRDLLRNAAAACNCQTDNIHYRHWLNVYRWWAMSRATDPNTGEIVRSAELVGYVDRVADELREALTACPTFGPTWCVLGQLERVILGREEPGARHIRQGVKLAPCDPTARFVAGMLEAEQGQTEAAFDHLRKAVQLDGHVFKDMAPQLMDLPGGPSLALRVAGDDMVRLSVMAGVLTASGGPESATAVRDRLAVLLEAKCREAAAPGWAFAWLASVYQKSGRAAEAITCYRAAVAQDYSAVDWRLALAQLLADTGDIRAAIREAQTCLRFRPGDAASKRLMERLSVDPRAVGQPYGQL